MAVTASPFSNITHAVSGSFWSRGGWLSLLGVRIYRNSVLRLLLLHGAGAASTWCWLGCRNNGYTLEGTAGRRDSAEMGLMVRRGPQHRHSPHSTSPGTITTGGGGSGRRQGDFGQLVSRSQGCAQDSMDSTPLNCPGPALLHSRLSCHPQGCIPLGCWLFHFGFSCLLMHFRKQQRVVLELGSCIGMED